MCLQCIFNNLLPHSPQTGKIQQASNTLASFRAIFSPISLKPNCFLMLFSHAGGKESKNSTTWRDSMTLCWHQKRYTIQKIRCRGHLPEQHINSTVIQQIKAQNFLCTKYYLHWSQKNRFFMHLEWEQKEGQRTSSLVKRKLTSVNTRGKRTVFISLPDLQKLLQRLKTNIYSNKPILVTVTCSTLVNIKRFSLCPPASPSQKLMQASLSYRLGDGMLLDWSIHFGMKIR